MSDRLTEKQELFSKCMFTPGSDSFGNGTESARRAKYGGDNPSDSYLAKIASQTVRKGNVIARKAEIQADIQAKFEYGLTKATELLKRQYEKADRKDNVTEALAAIREFDCIYGLQKQNITTKADPAAVIDAALEAELEAVAMRYKLRKANA